MTTPNGDRDLSGWELLVCLLLMISSFWHAYHKHFDRATFVLVILLLNVVPWRLRGRR